MNGRAGDSRVRLGYALMVMIVGVTVSAGAVWWLEMPDGWIAAVIVIVATMVTIAALWTLPRKGSSDYTTVKSHMAGIIDYVHNPRKSVPVFDSDQSQVDAAFRELASQLAVVLAGAVSARETWLSTLANRVLSEANQVIHGIHQCEDVTEDPELLGELFGADHQAVRAYRTARSLAVLSGSRRNNTSTGLHRGVWLHDVIRTGISWANKYKNVQFIDELGDTVASSVGIEISHLISELIDNATKFGSEDKPVYIRTFQVPGGTCVEIQDATIGMPDDVRVVYNRILQDCNSDDIHHALADGRIGLTVVALVAQRHRIGVRLDRSVYGGMHTTVVIPSQLLHTDADPVPSTPAVAPAAFEAGAEAPKTAVGAAQVPPGDTTTQASVPSGEAPRVASGATPLSAQDIDVTFDVSSDRSPPLPTPSPPPRSQVAQHATVDGGSDLPQRTRAARPSPSNRDRPSPVPDPRTDALPSGTMMGVFHSNSSRSSSLTRR